MKLRSLKNDLRAAVDLGVVLMIGIAFAGLTGRVKMLLGLNGDCIHHMDYTRYAYYNK